MRQLPDSALIAQFQNDPRIEKALSQPVGVYHQNPQIRLIEPSID
jgi:hypothetical protein